MRGKKHGKVAGMGKEREGGECMRERRKKEKRTGNFRGKTLWGGKV